MSFGKTVEPDLYTAVGIPEGVAFAGVNSELRRNLGALGVVVLLVGIAAWFGSEMLVLRRMRAMVNATEKLRLGDLSARTKSPHDSSEFGQLAGSFDAMAEALQSREGERDRARWELERTAADLAQKNEELESFTYSVSHDLKEPLRTLEAFSQFLIEDYSDRLDEQGNDYLGRISKASVRMKSLIDDLLTLSRLARRAEPPARVSVTQVVEDMRVAMEGSLLERNATIELDGPLPDVLADAPRVQQIFANLISNGIKFNSSDHPVLKIRAEGNKGAMATIGVEDNGIGIDAEYHERIFGVFQRLHAREEYEGTGAGLAIVKRAAEACGGSVRVESQLGRGSTFFVSLPAWEASSPALAA
jgi:signal transduction histidine kinase